MYDLNLQQTYCDGLIEAYWKFDKYGVISTEGKLNYDEIDADGTVVNIIAELVYEDESELYSFSNPQGLKNISLCPTRCKVSLSAGRER